MFREDAAAAVPRPNDAAMWHLHKLMSSYLAAKAACGPLSSEEREMLTCQRNELLSLYSQILGEFTNEGKHLRIMLRSSKLRRLEAAKTAYGYWAALWPALGLILSSARAFANVQIAAGSYAPYYRVPLMIAYDVLVLVGGGVMMSLGRRTAWMHGFLLQIDKILA